MTSSRHRSSYLRRRPSTSAGGSRGNPKAETQPWVMMIEGSRVSLRVARARSPRGRNRPSSSGRGEVRFEDLQSRVYRQSGSPSKLGYSLCPESWDKASAGDVCKRPASKNEREIEEKGGEKRKQTLPIIFQTPHEALGNCW